MTIGHRIKTAREYRGISQSELARRACIAPNSVSQYEADIIEPGYFALVHMADSLKVSLDWLAGRSVTMEWEEKPECS